VQKNCRTKTRLSFEQETFGFVSKPKACTLDLVGDPSAAFERTKKDSWWRRGSYIAAQNGLQCSDASVDAPTQTSVSHAKHVCEMRPASIEIAPDVSADLPGVLRFATPTGDC